MYRTIKKALKTTILLFTIIFLSGIGIYFYQALRNYYGYCRENGNNFSTQERLDNAITAYLSEQDFADYHEISQAEKMRTPEYNDYIKVRKDFDLIHYKNKDEFIKENPDCCNLTWGLVEGDQFGFWERADGVGNGMFNFKHKIRYQDQEGEFKEMTSSRTYYFVYNCGFARLRSYYNY